MAIEPISGFYVHDELTDSDGIAKYDFFGLENAPDNYELVHTESVSKTGSGSQRDWFEFQFNQGEQYLVEIDLESYTPASSGSGMAIQTYSSFLINDPTQNIVDRISGSVPASQVSAKKYRWAYSPSATNVYYLCMYFGIADNSLLQYDANIYRLTSTVGKIGSANNKANLAVNSEILLSRRNKVVDISYDDVVPTSSETRNYIPFKFKAGAKYLAIVDIDALISRNGFLLRTSTGSPGTVVDTIIPYTKEAGTYSATFTATRDVDTLYVYTSNVYATRVAYSVKIYEIEGVYGYEGEKVDLNEYTYNLGVLVTTLNNNYGFYQGMAIYGDKLYRLFTGGKCAVYDLSVADGSSQSAISVFDLGSADPSNHAGVANFSDTLREGHNIPPLYVSGGDANSPSTCFVEQISESNGAYSSTLLQTITLDQSGFGEAGLQTFFPWGKWCPYGDYLYLVSSLTRADGSTDKRVNKYIVTKFALPSVGEDTVLTANDVLEQFVLPYVDEFAQGVTIHNGKLFQVFGYPEGGFPARVSVVSLPSHMPIATLDISQTFARNFELEDCDVYNGQLIIGAGVNRVLKVTFC